jgi:UDP-glucose 4-epimerase
MLEHQNSGPVDPERVVILGASGFLGAETAAQLSAANVEILGLASADLDLADPGSAEMLTELLRPTDALVVFSALTPDKGRGIDTMMKNLTMAQSVCQALASSPCSHVVYISSDAVYPMDISLVDENSGAAPGDLYGMMHKAREIMFQNTIEGPMAVLRPTLIYGFADTHNSYGPNRFRRQADGEGKITIGGNGEETRDHVFVEDAAALIVLCLQHRSVGVLNVATGRSATFFDVAHLVAAQFDSDVEVVCTPRAGEITYRSFDVTNTHKAFPTFSFTSLADGIASVHSDLIEAS